MTCERLSADSACCSPRLLFLTRIAATGDIQNGHKPKLTQTKTATD